MTLISRHNLQVNRYYLVYFSSYEGKQITIIYNNSNELEIKLDIWRCRGHDTSVLSDDGVNYNHDIRDSPEFMTYFELTDLEVYKHLLLEIL